MPFIIEEVPFPYFLYPIAILRFVVSLAEYGEPGPLSLGRAHLLLYMYI